MENISGRRYGGEKNGFLYALQRVTPPASETQATQSVEEPNSRKQGVLFDASKIVHTLRGIARTSEKHPFGDVAKLLLTHRGSVSGDAAREVLGENRAQNLQDNPVKQIVEYDPAGDEFYSPVIIGYNNQLKRSPNFPR